MRYHLWKELVQNFFSNDVGRAYVHLGRFAGHCKFCWSFSHQLSYQFRVRAHTRCIKITLATNITLLWDIRFCAPNHTDTYKSLIIYRILHVSAQLYDCRLWGWHARSVLTNLVATFTVSCLFNKLKLRQLWLVVINNTWLVNSCCKQWVAGNKN